MFNWMTAAIDPIYLETKRYTGTSILKKYQAYMPCPGESTDSLWLPGPERLKWLVLHCFSLLVTAWSAFASGTTLFELTPAMEMRPLRVM